VYGVDDEIGGEILSNSGWTYWTNHYSHISNVRTTVQFLKRNVKFYHVNYF